MYLHNLIQFVPIIIYHAAMQEFLQFFFTWGHTKQDLWPVFYEYSKGGEIVSPFSPYSYDVILKEGLGT